MAKDLLEVTLKFVGKDLAFVTTREGEINIPPGASQADIQDALQRLICSMYRAIQMEKESLDKGGG